MLFFTSCRTGTPKPSSDDAIRAIKEYCAAQDTKLGDIKVVRFGDSGKADFSAPGAQDVYWAVEFDSPKRNIENATISDLTAPQAGVAHVYRTKMGAWKVGQIDFKELQFGPADSE